MSHSLNQTYPKCPRGEWHEVAPFWLTSDPVKPAPAPRGIMCLMCDRPIVVFDDDTEQRAVQLHVMLERTGPPVLGVSDKRAKPQ
jgi:hypothetical protein